MSSILQDINKALIDQINKLATCDLEAEKLKLEIKRSNSMAFMGKTIVNNVSLQFKAFEKYLDYSDVEPEKTVKKMSNMIDMPNFGLIDVKSN